MAANCDCITKLNEQLQEGGYNAVCDSKNCMTGIASGNPQYAGQAFLIPLRKRDSKKREPLPSMFVLYCPICGLKYGKGESKKVPEAPADV